MGLGHRVVRFTGTLNHTTGDSTNHPKDGSGTSGDWHIKGIDSGYHKHFIKIMARTGNDELSSERVALIAGECEIEASDDYGITFGSITNGRFSFNETIPFDRPNFMGAITEIKVNLKGVMEHGSHSPVTLFGTKVTIEVHSYN
ncbi:MAG: hypothetical protein ACRCR2_02415 [Fusobacteriaceae bacterium]